MQDLMFAVMPSNELQALVLVRSLRRFGRALAHTPVLMLLPRKFDRLSDAARKELEDAGARFIPYDVPEAAFEFPFGAKVFAAAQAEALLEGDTARLAWLDPDMLFIQEPAELLIPAGKQLGYTPVHHRLIGSPYDQPLDAYWSLLYRRCNVPAERVFPMETIVGSERIRPYVNAGLLVTRPAAGLLRAWRDRFAELFRDPQVIPFYQQDARCAVFLHQAVLAAEILVRHTQDDLIAFSRLYNYPLHLYAEDAPDQRPASINDLVIVRYEMILKDEDWQMQLPITGDLRTWIAAQFA